ncbi:MAG: methionine biosynthesis protein MetW [Thioalkalispiraceae bacterium]|jgi:methionine biosynthesis protein MetW
MTIDLRPELGIIASWIEPGSRILDLGCGDGSLLMHLRDTRQVSGYGLEIDESNIVSCVSHQVNVIQADLDKGLTGFEANSFDYVVMTQALQAMHYPDKTVEEMLRVGREAIITFPNFGHWRCRLNIARGRMPVTSSLPNSWYNTPNIHLCTLYDFEDLCKEKNIHILERTVVDHAHKSTLAMRLLPNLMGEIALYRLCRQ